MRARVATGIRAAAVVVGLGLAAAGCGSGAATPNACDLLSVDEATLILGTAALGPEEDTDRTIGGSFCNWRAEGTSSGEGDAAYGLFIDVAGDRGPADFERGRPSTGEGGDAEPVRGIGDEAYFTAFAPGELPFLEVRIGEEYLTLGVADDDEHPVSVSEAREMERRMAEPAIRRMG